MKLPLSVAYISYNEEHIIGKSISSIKEIASEVIVVDSNSQDNTRQIAKDLGALVFEEPWKGFVEQKNSALSKCSQEWILVLDCDEIVTPELASEIINIISNGTIGAFLINRRTVYLGKEMLYSWQPDRVLRLVHKSLKPKFLGEKVHEKLVCDFQNPILLKNEIMHYSYKSIKNHFEKTIRYAELSAESYFDLNRNTGLLQLLINPIFAFTNMYILKRGFLDGWRGLIAAFSSMTGTFLKYAILKQLKDTNR